MRLPKFEVELSLASASPTTSIRDAKNASVMERDVVIMNLYGANYIGVIRNTLHAGQGCRGAALSHQRG